MSEKPDLVASDPRVVARRHTAPLLKMLRGYGPVDPSMATPVAVRPVVTAQSASPAVADTAGVYLRLMAAPNRPPLSPPITDPTPTAPVPPRQCCSNIPTVGEALFGHSGGALGRLMTQASQLAQSNRVFQAYLPLHLRDHTILLQMDQERWAVQTGSASWATRLRYALHGIRQTLGQQLGFPLPKPHIRVVPVACPEQPQQLRLTLSQQNAQMLEVAARTILDVRLSTALQRLAQHAGPAGRPVKGT